MDASGYLNRRADEIAWLAGIFEGEGTLDFDKKCNTVRMTICMTDKDVLDRVCQVAGFGKVIPKTSPSRMGPKKKPMYQWRIGNRAECLLLANAIFPWLGERRKARISEAIQRWNNG